MSDSTTRFGERAGDYARFRPTYPVEAIEAVLDGFTAPVVADLGAGTGISSQLLAQAGATVYAIEPNASMRASIASHPNVTAIEGTAEATTLPGDSVDIVAAFQAYHWFDPARVLAEAARIGRERTRFAAVWNERDTRDEFVQAYEAIVHPYMTDDTEARRRKTTVDGDLRTAGWSDVRVLDFYHRQDLDWESLIGRTRSTSYLPREGAAFEEMAGKLRALYDRAEIYGGAHFVLVTSVHLGERQ